MGAYKGTVASMGLFLMILKAGRSGELPSTPVDSTYIVLLGIVNYFMVLQMLAELVSFAAVRVGADVFSDGKLYIY